MKRAWCSGILRNASRSVTTGSEARAATTISSEVPSTINQEVPADLPPNVIAAYLEPARLRAEHNVPSCQLQMRSYDVATLTFFADFAMRAAYHLGLPAKGPVPMPKKIERWTVPRGPFVHKKTQENFERITYKRMIKIADGHPEVVERWLGYLNANVMPGVGMKANTYVFETLGVGARMQEARTAAAIAGDSQQESETPNRPAEVAKKILASKDYQDIAAADSEKSEGTTDRPDADGPKSSIT